ncbi:unnamed protein product [Victoria cruziana]
MATTLESQLKAIKLLVQGDHALPKHPITRPSILFDPKEAADIDLETIFSIAISGLNILVETDKRFRCYKDTLFSQKSLDMDREVMTSDENNKINSSISSYLRLLSGYMQLPSAQKTLEYLIRRYKVHIYNVDELVMCILPYHDTHIFVCIVQILDLRKNKIWNFLEGVKISGAPMPRKTIVQQCLRDVGVLEAVCSYVMPEKKFLHSQTVVCFCTALIVEIVGSMLSLDNNLVKRVLPLVFASLNSSISSADYKAGAMMMVGVISSRAALAPGLVQDLIISLAKLAHQEAGQQGDMSWLHISLMGIINIVQSQPVKILPWRCVKALKGIREIPAVLSKLLKEYNIDKFLFSYTESLIHYCSSDDSCHLALIGLIEGIPMRNFIVSVVSKLLAICAKGPRAESGVWAVKILLALDKQYPQEFANAVHEFHEDCGDAAFESACLMFDLGPKLPMEVSNLKLWFKLEHPRAEVRRAALLDLTKADKEKYSNKKITVNIRESLLRRLHDDDLSVVQAALTVDGLCGLIDSAVSIKALQDITLRCCDLLKTGVTEFHAIAYDIAVSCLARGVNELDDSKSIHKEIATIFFPLLLVFPKTWKLNLRALELVKEVDWPFFKSLSDISHLESMKETKKLEIDASSVNEEIIEILSRNFTKHPSRYIPWLVECCRVCELSKPFVLMIMLKSFMMQKKASKTAHFIRLFEACFPVLKSEWLVVEAKGVAMLAEELKLEELDKIFSGYNTYRQIETKSVFVNAKLIVSTCWLLLESFRLWVHGDDKVNSQQYTQMLEDLFIFFATSQSKSLFKEHLRLLVTSCSHDPVLCLSNFCSDERFSVPVQVESLHLLVILFSTLASKEITIHNMNLSNLRLVFPSVLVPLASAEQAVRVAAADCVESLYKIWCRICTSSKQNGNKIMLDDKILFHSCWEVLGLIMQQKKMISLDQNFFQSFMKSLLSSRSNLLVPQDLDKRFNDEKKAEIIHFILRAAVNLPHHGKFVLLSMLKGVGDGLLFVEETKLLLSDLLERRSLYIFGRLNHEQKLLEVETGILCVLLEGWSSISCSSEEDVICDIIFKALKVDSASKELAIIKPCLAVLLSLTSDFFDGLRTELQDGLFQRLVILARSENAVIQKAAKDVLMRVHVTSITISRQLELVQEHMKFHSCDASKRLKLQKQHDLHLFASGEGMIHFLFSLFDFLLLKKTLESRPFLIEVLIELLYNTSSSQWISGFTSECNTCHGARVQLDASPVNLICHIQQAILSVLEDIAASLLSNLLLEKTFLKEINVDLLIKFMRRVEDQTVLNQSFTLITSLTKLVPSHVLPHMIDICIMAGESTIKQDDTHSQRVFENMISTLVPSWLSTSNDVEKLLQIFVEVLPQVSEGRRITLVTCLLRSLGESKSLGSLLVLLVRSLVQRMSKNLSAEDVSSSATVESEWEYVFAEKICLQYSCTVWLPSFLNLLNGIGTDNFSLQKASELQVSMRFILHKVEDTELMYKLEAGRDSDNLQGVFSALMEHVILHSKTSDLRMKQLKFPTSLRKELQRYTQLLLHTLMKHMVPSAFFMGITKLLRHVDDNLRKKALELLCEYVKGDVLASKKPKTRKQTSQSLIASDPETDGYFNDMSREIIQLVDTANDCSVKLAAVSAIEALSEKYPCDHSILSSLLTSVSKQIGSKNVAISAGCLRSTSALIIKLGVGALPLLPSIVAQVLEKARDVTSTDKKDPGNDKLPQRETSYRSSLLLSALTTLEALLISVGGFLNPYLQDIIELLVLNQSFLSDSDHKIKQQVTAIGELLSEKISVRLILSPLLKIYPVAVTRGELSVSATFKLIAALISKMDGASVRTYHGKLFEQCLVALDLRRRHPVSLKDVNTVEESVINAMVVLTMKLTEGLFKPVFCKTLEWAESELEEGSTGRKSIDRNIAFYKLVNKLAETHRSLFVPYFKYLTESCIHHLTYAEEQSSVSATQKRKKAKLRNSSQGNGDLKPLSAGQWHLRALVISSLHKCFLYDTGNLKFLDSSNFQTLLKPLVSQLIVDLPALSDQNQVTPAVDEVDDLLVSCLGQMATTAGTDLLWKPLNHEVLMQTRSEKLRPRILGLRIVKYLLDNLKEEYLVFLPETIPFLGELLEDAADLQVKSLAQDILRDMEKLSGENLRQYL